MSSSSTWSVSIRAWFSRRRRQSSLTASVLVAWPPVRRVAGTASAWLIGCGVPEVGVGMEARILGLVKVGSSGDGLGGSWVAMGGRWREMGARVMTMDTSGAVTAASAQPR